MQPRAKRDEIVAVHGERLKLRITAPPVNGKANTHLCACLAKLCGLSRSIVSLVASPASTSKHLRLQPPEQELPPALASFDNSVAKSGKY